MNRRKMRGPIDHNEVRELIEAYHHAKRIGRPLNIAVAINPAHLDQQPADVWLWFKVVLNKLRNWRRRQGFVYTCLWTRENYQGVGREHVHLLLHVPEHLQDDCEDALRRWCPGKPETVHCEHVTSDGAFTYMLKQMTPQALYALCGKVYREGCNRHDGAKVGKVLGKRCGTSKNLGPEARKAWHDRPRKGSIKAQTVVASEPKTNLSDAGVAGKAKGGGTPHPPPAPSSEPGPLSPAETSGSPVREHEPDLRPILVEVVTHHSEAGKAAPKMPPRRADLPMAPAASVFRHDNDTQPDQDRD